jgi:hypothetical protein
MMQANELTFRENFRISRAAFVAICVAIKAAGFYTRSPTGSTRGMHRHRIRCSVALAITLLYLSEKCSLRCVANVTGLSKATCNKHIHNMLRILAYHIFPKL